MGYDSLFLFKPPRSQDKKVNPGRATCLTGVAKELEK
jgi:hypothetical protein